MDKIMKNIEKAKRNEVVCNYSIETDENQPPFPRVKYNAECGFQLVVLEGYKRDVDGGITNELTELDGNCMGCKNSIKVD